VILLAVAIVYAIITHHVVIPDNVFSSSYYPLICIRGDAFNINRDVAIINISITPLSSIIRVSRPFLQRKLKNSAVSEKQDNAK